MPIAVMLVFDTDDEKVVDRELTRFQENTAENFEVSNLKKFDWDKDGGPVLYFP